MTGGSVARGKPAIGKYGCAACHTIPGVERPTATVGPPLTRVAVRQYLGGHLTNSPANMIKWIQHPQAIDPKNAMPELGVTDQDARDILRESFRVADAGWRITTVRSAGAADHGRRQAGQFGLADSSPIEEFDFYARLET